VSNTPDNQTNDSLIRAFTAQNRRAWEEIADVRQTKWQPASFFAQGGTLLDPRVLAVAGDMAGRLVGRFCKSPSRGLTKYLGRAE
jgi:hypothetical protein